jgi:hypothetical protein
VALRRLVLCTAALLPGAVLACGAHGPRLERWPSSHGSGSDSLWWVRAEHGDADASNRGVVSNLLIVRDGPRVWAVGSGPTRAFGRALGCVLTCATVASMRCAQRRSNWQRSPRGAMRLMGEQGEPARLGEVDSHITYWNARAAARRR